MTTRPETEPARPPAQARAGPGRRLAAALPRLALGAVVAAAVVGGALWIRTDSEPLVTDSYQYLTRLLELIDAGPPASPKEIVRAARELSYQGRPPLLQLLTLPPMLVLGRTEAAFFSVVLAFLALLAVATYRLGRAAGGPWAGVVAAALVVCYPPVVHLGHVYLPHLAAAAWGALTLGLMMDLLERPTPGRARWLGAACGVGLLLHPSFLWAVAPVLAVAGALLVWRPSGLPRRRRGPPRGEPFGRWDRARRRLEERLTDPLLWRGLVPAALIAAAIAAPWYLTVGRRILALQAKLTSPGLETLRGGRQLAMAYPDVEPGFWWYAVTAPPSLSWPLTALAVVGLVVCAVRGRTAGRLLVVAVAGTYAALAVQPTLSWLYGPLALPAAAAATAAALAMVRPRPLAAAAGALAVAVAVLVHVHVAWGGPPRVRAAAELAGAPRGLDDRVCRALLSFCAAPPRPDHWPVREMVARVLADPHCHASRPCRLFVVQTAGLSPTPFRYQAALDRPGVEVEISGQHEAVWGQAFPFEALLRADFVLFADWRFRAVDEVPPGRRYRIAATRLLHDQPPLFARSHATAGRFPLPSGLVAVLLRRETPLTAREAEETIAALDLDPRYKRDRYALMATLYAAAGDLDALDRVLAQARAAPKQVRHRELKRIERLAELADLLRARDG